jgi:plasmid stabilization system protein ParE
MTFQVEWSHEANQTFIQTLEWIKQKWTDKEIENFIARTQQVIELIGQNPAIYPFSKKGLVYRAVISKQTSLYYHIPSASKKVVLLSFEDNRQNPSRLKY